MKLHVGCGNVILPGWVNVDIDNIPGVDIQDDVRTLKKINNNSCDIIYASHVLEHFGRNEFESILKLWNTKLKLKGILRLAVPDFEKSINWYNKTKRIEDILGQLSGGQKSEFDYHKMVYDKFFLSMILEICGFGEIKEWDWRQTEHSDFDDYSQSYMPHMEKDTGMLMSLNLEAIKLKEPSIDNANLGKSPWQKSNHSH
jgi:predicted SAM-dependent methyltransferase